MPTPVREAALAAVHARLAAELPALLPGAVAERARRAPVNFRSEALPRAVLTGGDIEADTTQSPGETFYTIEFEVAGYTFADADSHIELAQAELHAAIVAALVPWQPATAGLGEVTEQGAELGIVPAAESARRAAEVRCSFTILAITPTGSPYL
jgi:hypothetical protein